MERVTRQNVEDRVANVNRRMESRGSRYRYSAQARNGYIGLDRIYRDTENGPGSIAGTTWSIASTVTAGTKREVADFLHAMMVALDDAETKP